jgi:ketosteroid isomerase-like protein
MRRRKATRDGVLLALVIGGFATAEVATAAETEIDHVAAAVQANFAALAAFDVPSVTAGWAHKPYVMRIGPNSKVIAVGWDAVQSSLENTAKRLSETYASVTFSFMERHIRAVGDVAWLVGTLEFQGRGQNGQSVTLRDFVTDVLEKDGDRWLMVSHHAQRVPD